MTDREAFLAAIAAVPWDDELPRLVFADWLDEHGEHDEAMRQRMWLPAERWLRDFAAANKVIDHGNLSGREFRPRWVERPMTLEEVLDNARHYAEAAREPFGLASYFPRADSSDASAALEKPETRIAFWRHVATLTGMPVEHLITAHGDPFVCGC